MKSVSEIIDSIKSWFESSAEPGVDTEYLRSEDFTPKHIRILDDGPARCQICGKLEAVQRMPQMIEHIACHDDQGSAELDPTETQEVVAEIDYSDLLTDEEPDKAENEA